jgi:HTH-type transcriptional regulator/antitoxin HipB
MLIRTYKDIGALIRHKRKEQGWDQKSLAQKVGVSRQWLIEVEKGKPRAEVGLVLRVLEALGVSLTTAGSAGTEDAMPDSKLDEVIARARRLEHE